MDNEAQGCVPEARNKIDGLSQQDSSKRFGVPSAEPTTVQKVAQAILPKKGMAACNVRLRKQQENYIPNMKGNKYVVALTQIVASLIKSKYVMFMAQMSVNLMT